MASDCSSEVSTVDTSPERLRAHCVSPGKRVAKNMSEYSSPLLRTRSMPTSRCLSFVDSPRRARAAFVSPKRLQAKVERLRAHCVSAGKRVPENMSEFSSSPSLSFVDSPRRLRAALVSPEQLQAKVERLRVHCVSAGKRVPENMSEFSSSPSLSFVDSPRRARAAFVSPERLQAKVEQLRAHCVSAGKRIPENMSEPSSSPCFTDVDASPRRARAAFVSPERLQAKDMSLLRTRYITTIPRKAPQSAMLPPPSVRSSELQNGDNTMDSHDSHAPLSLSTPTPTMQNGDDAMDILISRFSRPRPWAYQPTHHWISGLMMLSMEHYQPTSFELPFNALFDENA